MRESWIENERDMERRREEAGEVRREGESKDEREERRG